MIIDSHAHLKHGDAQRTEYTAETIVEVMDAVGIDKSVVFAMSTTTKMSIIMAKEACEKFPDRLIPYVYALPSYEEIVIEKIEDAISRLGFRGIKLHAGECTLSDYVVDPVIELAGKLDVPCLIDCMGRYDMIQRIVEKFNHVKIIIAHFGQYLCRDKSLIDKFIELARKYENVFLDTSGTIFLDKIQEAVEQLGAERIIFGIDGPHKAPDLVTFALTELNKIKALNISTQAKEAILYRNIAGLLHI